MEHVNIHNSALPPLSHKYANAIRVEIKALNDMEENNEGLGYSEKIRANRLLKPLDEEAIAINEEMKSILQKSREINKEIDILNEKMRARRFDFEGKDLYYGCDTLKGTPIVIDHNELQADKNKLASVVSQMQALFMLVVCNSKIEKFIASTALNSLIKC